jgi:recombinational DNA repair protein RecR
MEKHRADWNRRGGKEEDKILRLLLRTPSATALGLKEARRLVRTLLDADRARLDRLQQDLRALTQALETRQAG